MGRLPGHAQVPVQGRSCEDAGGYVLPGQETTLAVTVGRRADRAVLHQYVLQLLHRELPGLPPWLVEGIAGYYDSFEVADGEVHIGLPWRNYVFMSRDELVDAEDEPSDTEHETFEDLLSATSASLGGQPLSQNSRLAATRLFHYLMQGNADERRRITAYMRRTLAGDDPVDAFVETFGIEPGDIADVLTEAARADEIQYFSIDISALDPVPLTSRPSTGPELDLALGELLFELGEEHWPEAEARLARAVAAPGGLPGTPRAWARLARIDQARGDLDAADTRLARALELDPDEAAYLTLRADVLMAKLGDARPTDAAGEARLAEARSLLVRATQLEPEAGETWARLGHAGLLAATPDPEAPAHLERALELLPRERPDILYNLALAQARAGDRQGLGETMDRMIRQIDEEVPGASPELVERARQMALQLDVREATRLARADRIGDAVSLLAVVVAEADDPRLREAASQLLDQLSRAEWHNRFVAEYDQAVELYRAGAFDGASALLDRMEAGVEGREVSQSVLRDLRRRIERARGDG
jgi:tetratricopeptide (TPR) repeat protein